MYIKDGIMYGEQHVDSLKIIDVKPLQDRIFLLQFNNGDTRLFDVSELTAPVFSPLKDESVLKNYHLDHGVLTWMNGTIDCAPEYMYAHSYEYSMIV